MTRVLFVDDELNILGGLRRLLRRAAPHWEVHFAECGAEALELVERVAFDAVVSDCMMPGMDGGTLLERVRGTRPAMVRIMLTGNAPAETMLRGEAVAHRLLSKPCPPERLRASVESALAALKSIPEGALRKLVAGTPTLPVRGDAMKAASAAVGDGSVPANVDRIASVVDGSPGLEAKLLKLVHAGFFGGRAEVTDGADAVRRLGPDAMSVLMRQGLPGDPSIPVPLDLAAEDRHAVAVAEAAGGLAARERWNAESVIAARVAARLLGIGRLLAAVSDPGRWQAGGPDLMRPGLGATAMECELLGMPAATLGASLLSLWGLPPQVTDAVANAPRPAPGTLAELVARADQWVRSSAGEDAAAA